MLVVLLVNTFFPWKENNSCNSAGKCVSVDHAVILQVSQRFRNVSFPQAAVSCLTHLTLILHFAICLKIGKGESS